MMPAVVVAVVVIIAVGTHIGIRSFVPSVPAVVYTVRDERTDPAPVAAGRGSVQAKGVPSDD